MKTDAIVISAVIALIALIFLLYCFDSYTRTRAIVELGKTVSPIEAACALGQEKACLSLPRK